MLTHWRSKAVINADQGVLADTNFGNCTYGYSIACTFETTLTAAGIYRVSVPFTLRVPRDAVAASQTTLSVQWLTAAEWQDWQADFGELSPGRPGTGPDLELDEVAVSAGLPQADTDNDDNGSYTTVTVAGGRRTDVVAIGAAIPGTAGAHTITVGLVNQGPGTMRYPPFANNVPAVRVTLPLRMSVVTADDRCTSLSEDAYETPPSSAPDGPAGFSPPEFSCMPRSVTLRPGQHLTFRFTVRIARAARDEEGSVQVDLYSGGDNVDRDLRNNQAKITVKAAAGGGGLPITGTTAATIASGGLLLMLLGAVVVAALRRRTPAQR